MKTDGLLNVKLLAAAIGVCEKTIYRARWSGFEMPGGVSTVDEFRDWQRAELRKKRCGIGQMSKNVQSSVMPS